MNKVILIGNLTRDPELSQTSGGIAYCRMSIAVNHDYVDKDGNRGVDYFNVVAWRELGETCNKYLAKGKKMGVEGRLQTRTYEQDGVKKYATDIIAEKVEFLTPKTDGEDKKLAKSDPEPPIDDDSLPF